MNGWPYAAREKYHAWMGTWAFGATNACLNPPPRGKGEKKKQAIGIGACEKSVDGIRSIILKLNDIRWADGRVVLASGPMGKASIIKQRLNMTSQKSRIAAFNFRFTNRDSKC